MTNFSDKSFRENQNIIFCLVTFFSENRTNYETVWKNVDKSDKPHITI